MRSIISRQYLSVGIVWAIQTQGLTHACAQAGALNRFQYTELHMGMQARIVLYARDREHAETAARAAFQRISDLDDCMSDYKPTSELMRLCERAGGPPVKVSPDLYRVVDYALQIASRSEGALDITVGPYVALWRAARKSGVFPTAPQLAEARAVVGWMKVKLDPAARTIKLLVPGMKLDLGGIGKGFADDCAMDALKAHGIRSALVEMGGDIVVSAAPPGKPGWIIEVANPGHDPKRVLTVKNCGVSSSGDTENFEIIGGKRYSHIVDPHTGLGLTTRVAVTVLAPNGITSDGLSKPLSILSAEKGQELLKRYPGTTAYVRRLD